MLLKLINSIIIIVKHSIIFHEIKFNFYIMFLIFVVDYELSSKYNNKIIKNLKWDQNKEKVEGHSKHWQIILQTRTILVNKYN